MLFHKLYDSRESYHLTGPILDPRALLRMTAREGRALGNNICFVEYETEYESVARVLFVPRSPSY